MGELSIRAAPSAHRTKLWACLPPAPSYPDAALSAGPAPPLQHTVRGLYGAQFNLGQMYETGDGVPEDDVEAVRWFRLAAEQGYAPAQSVLGVMYNNGRGVSENDAEAVRWFRLGAEQWHPVAQFNLGVMYINGDGVLEDRVLALMWCLLSASQGNETALSRKESFEQGMTREQITEAQERALAWIRARP